MLHVPLNYIVGLFLASLCSIPVLDQISKRLLSLRDRNPYNHDGLYKDEDGVASDRAQRMEVDTILQIFILVCSMVGLLLSVVAVVNTALCNGHRMPLASLPSCGIWV